MNYSLIQLLITGGSFVLGIGIIYGSFKNQISRLDKDNKEMKETIKELFVKFEKISAIDAKVDLIINHFLN